MKKAVSATMHKRLKIIGIVLSAAFAVMFAVENFWPEDADTGGGKLRIFDKKTRAGTWATRGFTDETGRKASTIFYGVKKPTTPWETFRCVLRVGKPRISQLVPLSALHSTYDEEGRMTWQGQYGPKGGLLFYQVRVYRPDGKLESWAWYNDQGIKQ